MARGPLRVPWQASEFPAGKLSLFPSREASKSPGLVRRERSRLSNEERASFSPPSETK